MSAGIVVAAVGGLVIALGYVVSLPAAADVVGAALFVLGIVVVGVGGGLKTAWEVLKALFP